MADVLIRVVDAGQSGVCAGCGAPITWFPTLQDRRMPINREAVPERADIYEDQRVLFFRASASHWATCPNREQFKRR